MVQQEFKPHGSKSAPLVGEVDLLDQAVHCISANWEGDVSKVFVNTKPSRLSASWFAPNDNGALSIYGVNKNGDIIFGMAYYKGDRRSENELERRGHYYIKKMSNTDRLS